MARLISIGIALGISALLLGKLVVAAEQAWHAPQADTPVAAQTLRQ